MVSGHVQGVWYRASTQEQARILGLKGWVRNHANGCVEVIACGEPELLKQMEVWIWKGPPLAQVTQVVVKVVSNSREGDLPEPFEIR